MANNPNAKANLKPFTKGDKRINKDGRPATAASLSALARRIAHEPALKKNGAPVIGQDGKPVTKIEAILLQWAQDPKHQADFVERGFGKVATPVDVTSKGERITGFVAVSPEDWEHGDGDENA